MSPSPGLSVFPCSGSMVPEHAAKAIIAAIYKIFFIVILNEVKDP